MGFFMLPGVTELVWAMHLSLPYRDDLPSVILVYVVKDMHCLHAGTTWTVRPT
jgi:hypothetical protein